MTQIEITLALAASIAEPKELRTVIEFYGDHKGETLFIDFSDLGEDFCFDDTVCVWGLYRDIYHGEKFAGVEEIDGGCFSDVDELVRFIERTTEGMEVKVRTKSF